MVIESQLNTFLYRFNVEAEELFEIWIIFSILVASNLFVRFFLKLAVVMFRGNWSIAEALSTGIGRSKSRWGALCFTTDIGIFLVVGECHVKA